jgi:membrane-associated phospholipid phosphatase
LEAIWNFVTDFGDTAVTLPLAALAFAFLLFSRQSRAAWLLAFTLAACGIGIALAKLALQSCAQPLLQTDVINPSGHAAVSTAVYGALAMLFAYSPSSERRWVPAACASFLIGGIAVSRVVLDDHSMAEVIVGLIIGLAALTFFCGALAARPGIILRRGWLTLGVAGVIAVMHGSRWPIEEIVHSIVRLIRHSVSGCT